MTEREQRVQAAYAAWNRGDFERLGEVVAASFELDLSRRLVEPGVYRGREEIMGAFTQMTEGYTDLDFRVERYVRAGDAVVTQVAVSARGAASGIEMSQAIGHVWRFDDDMPVRVEYHGSFEEALRAARDG